MQDLESLIVIGDIHGDFESLSNALDDIDVNRNAIIFLGDYADRGPDGVKVVRKIDNLTKKHPKTIIALKGNHEDFSQAGNPKFNDCSLKREIESKNENWQTFFIQELKPFVDKLYLAAIIPDEILFVHGGISSDIRVYNDLRNPTVNVEKIVLWSDPFEGKGQRFNKERNIGIQFGEDITMEVCANIGVKKIIRSHEPGKAQSGPYYSHGKKIITVSSTDVYGGSPFALRINPLNLDHITPLDLRKHQSQL
ncbi:metallophosphoesterase family protein [Candidatus Bathycorpusculum sp.]|uniref:metallophosphoesterase family protein n=1 Tax=Candidatus Bathycorpusculum sp. TaxID=2994959 RepID=UPI002830EC58|nr:serine/threonine protein phosphatase [Candidatus Termitimicrobium sp.]